MKPSAFPPAPQPLTTRAQMRAFLTPEIRRQRREMRQKFGRVVCGLTWFRLDG